MLSGRLEAIWNQVSFIAKLAVKFVMKAKHILYIFIALILAFEGCVAVDVGQQGSAAGRRGLSAQINNEIRPYALDLAAWEINNLLTTNHKVAVKGPGATDFSGLPENVSTVLIAENFTVFPQVRVKLVEPPLLLVISPRDRIAYYDRILLTPGLTGDSMEQIEGKVDALDLSSLIVQLGGFGAAYPAIVSPDMADQHIINAVVEEWAHQYLAFKPLGFLYLVDSLGWRQAPDVIVMNETLAGMIAREIGSKVYERYYSNTVSKMDSPDPGAFDFNREMRETRLKVDGLLAAGKIEEAERYMQDRRIVFNRKGYAIRKLNQAYFAFHGIYGQDPGAVSPVYSDMLKLRKNYAGLAGFVDKISGMTTYAELERSVSGPAD
jgi:hypothetical protein